LRRGAKSRGPHAVQNPARKDNSRKCPQTPYPYWRSITHCSQEQLSNQNCGKEEKPRICEKDTIKRRKEGTMRENRAMVKRLGLRKPGEPQVSRNTLPSKGAVAVGIQLPIGQGAHIWGNVLRCYARRWPPRVGPLRCPL